MTTFRNYRRAVAVFLLVLYLLVPVLAAAHADNMAGDDSAVGYAASTLDKAPCGDCPCSGEQSGQCCDAPFCWCACHASLAGGLQLTYHPVVARLSVLELSFSFPQVYRTIFVPPQNLL